jgi:Zn-dependent M16 (insulinase) family peptidase
VEAALKERVPQDEMEKAVIGAIGALDRPLDPAGRGIRPDPGILGTHRCRPSRFRGEVLDATPESLQDAARRYFPKQSRRR